MLEQNKKGQNNGSAKTKTKTNLFGGFFNDSQNKNEKHTKKDQLENNIKNNATINKLQKELNNNKNLKSDKAETKELPIKDEIKSPVKTSVGKEQFLTDTNSQKKELTPKRDAKEKTSFFSFFGFSPKTELKKEAPLSIEKKGAELQNKKKLEEKQKGYSSKNVLSKLFQKDVVKKEKTKESPKGTKEEVGKKNLFVDLFPKEAKKNENDSLIETIVEQSEKTPSILGQKLRDKRKESEQKQDQKEEKNDTLFWSHVTIAISLIVPLAIYTFFYFQLTTDSKIVKMLGVQNTGITYQEKLAEQENLNKEISETKIAITKLEETSKQVLMEKTINEIKKNQDNWLIVMKYIDEVTNTAVQYNKSLKRVVYNSYDYKNQEREITLSAKIFDPNKKVFTSAASLIDAVNNSEYFEGLENRNFAKSINDDGAEMSLTMNFNYIPELERKNLTSVLD